MTEVMLVLKLPPISRRVMRRLIETTYRQIKPSLLVSQSAFNSWKVLVCAAWSAAQRVSPAYIQQLFKHRCAHILLDLNVISGCCASFSVSV